MLKKKLVIGGAGIGHRVVERKRGISDADPSASLDAGIDVIRTEADLVKRRGQRKRARADTVGNSV